MAASPHANQRNHFAGYRVSTQTSLRDALLSGTGKENRILFLCRLQSRLRIPQHHQQKKSSSSSSSLSSSKRFFVFFFFVVVIATTPSASFLLLFSSSFSGCFCVLLFFEQRSLLGGGLLRLWATFICAYSYSRDTSSLSSFWSAFFFFQKNLSL